MENKRSTKIAIAAGDGNFEELMALFAEGYTADELNMAFENAIAYAQLQIADYLLSLGAYFSWCNFNGVYYAVHNNELEGLKFAIANGVDINVNEGMLLNTGIITAVNEKDISIVKWLLENGAQVGLLNETSFRFLRDASGELREIIEAALKKK